MMNFARFIPGTPDADFMRQQVGERGILEKIDAVNETIKRCLGEDYPVSVISNFYKMITDIEHSLNQNMNDPRAKKLVNTFDEVPETSKAETKKETPKPETQETQETPETPEKPDATDPNEDAGADTGTDTGAGTVDPTENTGVIDPAEGGESGETGDAGNMDITDNPVSEEVTEGVSEGIQETAGEGDNSESEGISEGTQEPSTDNGESTGPDTTEPEPAEPETKHPTRRSRKKSEGAE